jgi:carboxylate-amine ligase
VEEEFALVNPETLELVPGFEVLRDAAREDDVLAVAVAGELISSEIEIRSGAGRDHPDALERQRVARRRLFALGREHGIALGATGTHPLSDYRDQQIIDTEHYRRVEDGLRYVAWRNNTFSVHVHVGVQGADRAVRVCDRLRPILPTLLAISANSPFIDGRDSGLHSGRTQIFTKSFPRCGIPDAFGTWDAWARYVELLVRTRSIVEFTQLWWSVRPHHAFGTVEVRICDAQTTGAESDALAELIVACVAQAARDVDAGVEIDVPPRLIEENMWRAIRFGMDGRLIRLTTGEEREMRAVVDDMLAWTAPVRAEHGIGDPAFGDRNSAQRQRALIAEGLSPAEVYAATVRETRATYAQEVPTA